MRPLRLSIQGFTAFRERQEIDLTDLELFCITGPTGAGKTTIFDAIAFALYGRAPRVGGQVRRLVATGCHEAAVELEFRAGGGVHRAARSIRRTASGQSGHRALLQTREGDEWESTASGPEAVTRRAEQLTGLDFTAFRRAVMLPQGEFAEFLAGSAAERRTILSRLLDLGRYEEAGRRARDAARGHATRAESLSRTVEAQLADATAQAVTRARRARTSATRRVSALAETLVAVRGTAGERAHLVERGARMDGIAARLTAIARDAAEDAERGGTLRDRRRHADDAVAACADALARADAALVAADAALAETTARTGSAADLAVVRTAVAARTEAASEVRSAGEDAAALDVARQAATAAGASALAAVEQATITLGAAADRRADADAARDAAAAALEGARARAAAEAHAATTSAAGEQAAARAGAAHGRAEQAAAALAAARAGVARLELADRAGALRVHLHEGAPCPVCERTLDGPAPDVPHETAAALDEARRALDAAQTASEAASRDERAALAAAQAAVALAGDARSRAEDLAGHPAVPDAERALQGASAAAADAAAAHAAAVTAHEAARTAATEAHARLGVLGERAAAITARAEKASTRLASAEQRITATLGDPAPDDPLAAVAAREHDLAAVTAARVVAARVRDEAAAAHGAALEAARGAERAEAELAARLAAAVAQALALDDELALLLTSSGAQAPAALRLPRRAAGATPDPTAVATSVGERAALAAEAAAACRAEAEGRTQAIAAHLAGAGVSAAEGAESGVVEAALAEARTAAGRADADLDAVRRRKETRDALEGEAATARDEAATLELLGRHLRSDGFLDFVLAESLARVCAAASTRLQRMSAGRYTLVAGAGADAGALLVVDHHNAGERRGVDTLSGGETFQASLALALALTESAGDMGATSRLEAVFVDEGFAALDAESLDLAIDALESVRADDRMVGVITHLPQLADRIPQGLEVVRGVAGSTVTRRAA